MKEREEQNQSTNDAEAIHPPHYHKQTDAQPVSKHQPHWKTKSSSVYCWTWHHTAWNIPLANLGQLSQLCCLPASSLPHAYSLGLKKQQSMEKKPWCCASTIQLTARAFVCYQHCFSHKSKKHSTIWAALQNVNYVPSRPSAPSDRRDMAERLLWLASHVGCSLGALCCQVALIPLYTFKLNQIWHYSTSPWHPGHSCPSTTTRCS